MLKGVTRSVSPMMCNVGSGKRWSAWRAFHRKRSISSVTWGMEQGVGNIPCCPRLLMDTIWVSWFSHVFHQPTYAGSERKCQYPTLPFAPNPVDFLRVLNPNFYIQEVVSQAFSQAASPLVVFLRVPPFSRWWSSSEAAGLTLLHHCTTDKNTTSLVNLGQLFLGEFWGCPRGLPSFGGHDPTSSGQFMKYILNLKVSSILGRDGGSYLGWIWSESEGFLGSPWSPWCYPP